DCSALEQLAEQRNARDTRRPVLGVCFIVDVDSAHHRGSTVLDSHNRIRGLSVYSGCTAVERIRQRCIDSIVLGHDAHEDFTVLLDDVRSDLEPQGRSNERRGNSVVRDRLDWNLNTVNDLSSLVILCSYPGCGNGSYLPLGFRGGQRCRYYVCSEQAGCQSKYRIRRAPQIGGGQGERKTRPDLI